MLAYGERLIDECDLDDLGDKQLSVDSAPPDILVQNAAYSARDTNGEECEEEVEVLLPQPSAPLAAEAPIEKPSAEEADDKADEGIGSTSSVKTIAYPIGSSALQMQASADGRVQFGDQNPAPGQKDLSTRECGNSEVTALEDGDVDKQDYDATQHGHRLTQYDVQTSVGVSTTTTTPVASHFEVGKEKDGVTREVAIKTAGTLGRVSLDADSDGQDNAHDRTRGGEEEAGSDVAVTGRAAEVEEDTSVPKLQAGDSGGDGLIPPHDGAAPDDDNDREGNELWELEGGELDAALASRYEESFSETVPQLAQEVAELEDPVTHPDFIARGGRTGLHGVATFRVGTNTNPDDKLYVVRILSEDELRYDYQEDEEIRHDALLQGTKLGVNTRDDIEQIVAHGVLDGRGISVTRYAGVSVAEMTPEEWDSLDTLESMSQLRDVVLDMVDHNIGPDPHATNLVWDRDRQRIVIVDYVGGSAEDTVVVGTLDVTELAERQSDEFINLVLQLVREAPTDEIASRIGIRSLEAAGEYYRGVLSPAEYPEETGAAIAARNAYVNRVYQVNMPELGFISGGRLVMLGTDVQEYVRNRPRDMLDISYDLDHSLDERERALIHGLAEGRSEEEAVAGLNMNRLEISRMARMLSERLVATNEVSMVYNAFLHGTVTSSPVAGLSEPPELTRNEQLHLYLAALGIGCEQAAELTGRIPDAVKRHYSDLMQKFHAATMSQVMAQAFAVGYFTPLPIIGETAYPTDQVMDGATAQQLRNIARTTPVPAEPTAVVSGNEGLRLPHGCVIEYRERAAVEGQPRTVDIRWIEVPAHLRGHQGQEAPSIGQRLVDGLRDRCREQGVERVVSVATHPGGLIAMARSFGTNNITMDGNGQTLPTLEAAVDYLRQGNRDVLVKVDLKQTES